MGEINYKKLLLKLIEDNHHELNKIEKVILDSRNGDYYNRADLSFDFIINDKEWNAEEKEKLLRLFGYEKFEHKLEYTSKYNNTEEMDAASHMIAFDNLSGFTAYMNCFKDIKQHYVGSYITKDEAYKSILYLINAQTDKQFVERKDIKYSKVFTKERELEFMKAALSILSEEDKKRLCADYYVAHTLKAVSNESIFINIIKTCNIELIDEYVKYIDNISSYLSYAVETGNISVVKHFLDLGADINYYPNEGIYGLLTPLKRAITNNDYEMVKFLTDNGADIDLSVQEKDFIDNLHNTSLNIFDRWNNVHLKNCKENDNDVKDLKYLRTSTPLEYAITLEKDNNYLHKYCYNRYSISFEGETNYVKNSINIDIHPTTHTEEQINRAKIVNLLFEKSNKQFDATNLICSALVTQDTENINKYINYVIENKMEIDINRVFKVFLSLNLNDFSEFIDVLMQLIKQYSENPTETIKELFDKYLEEKAKHHVIKEFYLNDYTNTLLNCLSSDERKNIILMPYVKDVATAQKLLELGFDINQTDENGINILINLLGNRSCFEDITKSEKELFEFLTAINPETNKRLIDITHKDNNNKNALYYALQEINTKDEYLYGSKEKVYTYTEFEGVVADLIDMLPAKEVNNPDILNVLENRMTTYSSDYGERIYAEFVYQHHEKLMRALRRKKAISDKMYEEIFEKLNPTDERESEVLNKRVQVESSIDFVYEVLDKNTKIQKLSIENNYNKYIKYLKTEKTTFEEYTYIFKKLIFDLDKLKLFYEQNITKKYDQNKYLKYVKDKYNVSYNDLSYYVLKLIIFGIKEYGSDKLPIILELCPGYDINTILYGEDIDMYFYSYLEDVIIDHYYDDGYPVQPINRFEPENININEDGKILFTGSLIHYGILINDIKLVEYLKSIGANAKLVIENQDYSWDYVNSLEMTELIEPEIGSKDLSGLTEDEKKYLLSL